MVATPGASAAGRVIDGVNSAGSGCGAGNDGESPGTEANGTEVCVMRERRTLGTVQEVADRAVATTVFAGAEAG